MTKSTGRPEVAGPQNGLMRLNDMLVKAEPAFQSLGRKYIDPKRFIRIVMAAARRPGKGGGTILDCTPQSVVLACMEAAAVGLEPNTPQAHCYLIPYGNSCTLQFGYPGLVALALRQPDVKRIETRLRYERDTFEPQYAPTVSLHHLPVLDGDRGAKLGVYSIVHFTDGDMDFEYMEIEEVDQIKARVKGADNAASPWVTSYDEMAKKTVLKRACKRWGKSKELARATQLDNADGPVEPEPEVADLLASTQRPARDVSSLAPEPKTDAVLVCDRKHEGPPCTDPDCYLLTGDPEPSA